MIKKQRYIWIIGIVIAILMLIFPPWEFYVDTRNVKIVRNAGYHLLWKQPRVPITSTSSGFYGTYEPIYMFNNISISLWSVRINTVKLIIQLGILISILTLVNILLESRRITDR